MSVLSLDELKAELSIEDVLLACGAEFPVAYTSMTEIPFFCPFHVNTNTPAASMNPLKGVFFCYSCDAAGSVIDAAMLYLQTDDVYEAAEWLEEEFLA